MNTLNKFSVRWARLLVPAILLAISLILLLGRATPVGAGSTFYYSLLAGTMSPADSTIQFDNLSTAFLTTRENSTIPGNLTLYNGQINLPDGSTINGMGCDGRDTDPGNEFSIFMSRFSIDNSPTVWDIISSGTGSGVSYQASNIKISGTITTDHGQQIVNNAVYAYNIAILLPKATTGTTLGVLRCWVSTTYPVMLSIVRK